MDRHQFCVRLAEQRLDVSKELARDVFGGRHDIAERCIVFVGKLVIKLVVDNLAGAAFDFADVDQHSGDGIDVAAKNEIDYVVAAGAILRAALLAEPCYVLFSAPSGNEQSPRG